MIVLLAGERTARAAASARLFYGRAPAIEGCPDESDLRRAIAQRVGYDPIFLMAPNSVTVSIVREGGQLLADIKLANREGMLVGSRKLQAPAGECGELTATIALTVAIALDTIDTLTAWEPPGATSTPSGPAAPSSPTGPAPEPPPPTSAPQEGSHSSPSRPDAVPDRRWPSSLHLEVGVGIGGAPYGGRSDLRGGRNRVRVSPVVQAPDRDRGVGRPPRVGTRERSPGRERAGRALSGGGATGCLHFGPYFGCAVAFVGSLRAEAPGVPGASTGASAGAPGGSEGGNRRSLRHKRLAALLGRPPRRRDATEPCAPAAGRSGRRPPSRSRRKACSPFRFRDGSRAVAPSHSRGPRREGRRAPGDRSCEPLRGSLRVHVAQPPPPGRAGA